MTTTLKQSNNYKKKKKKEEISCLYTMNIQFIEASFSVLVKQHF
jgi:hypothetical protein